MGNIFQATLLQSEKSKKLVEKIAGLCLWDFDKDDGTPYKECEEPDDGYLDSHDCLMNLIEEARAIQEGSTTAVTK